MKKSLLARWRSNFFTGLAVVLPAILSVAVIIWLFGKVSNITDALLFFLPRSLTHLNNGAGEMYWHWSLVALILAVLLISGVGRLMRHYFGKQLVQMIDQAMLGVPLLNKVYGTIKQVNEAFSTSNKSSFRQVVLVEFPREGQYAMGFVTGEQPPQMEEQTHKKLVSVFVPTTPNPTGGFLILVPEAELTKLNMSVADGIKFIISLGAITPDANPATPHPGKAAATRELQSKS